MSKLLGLDWCYLAKDLINRLQVVGVGACEQYHGSDSIYIYIYVCSSQSIKSSQINGALVDEVVVAWDEIGCSSSSSSSSSRSCRSSRSSSRNGCRQ